MLIDVLIYVFPTHFDRGLKVRLFCSLHGVHIHQHGRYTNTHTAGMHVNDRCVKGEAFNIESGEFTNEWDAYLVFQTGETGVEEGTEDAMRIFEAPF